MLSHQDSPPYPAGLACEYSINSKRNSAPVAKDSEDTQSTHGTLRFSWISYTVTFRVLLWCVRVFQLFEVDVRFQETTPRFLVLISSI